MEAILSQENYDDLVRLLVQRRRGPSEQAADGERPLGERNYTLHMPADVPAANY